MAPSIGLMLVQFWSIMGCLRPCLFVVPWQAGLFMSLADSEGFVWQPLACESLWSSPLNSLAPRKFEWNFRHVIFKQILVIDGWCICCEIALIWMSLDFADDQSTLVQVMAWCRQATSHYLSQCWPRSMSPYGVTGPQWVNPWHAESIIGNIKIHLH